MPGCARGGNQVGAVLGRGSQALVTPPALNVGVVARQQLGRHGAAILFFRAGVVRTIQQTIERWVEAIELVAAFVIQNAGL